MGSRVGLNYESLEILLRLMKVKQSERMKVFSDVQVMEMAALQIFNDEAKKKG